MDYSVQAIGPEHLEESARVIRQSHRTVADEFGFTAQSNPSNGAFIQPEKLLEELHRGIRMFGLYTAGRQVGFVAIEHAKGTLYYLEKLSVVPDSRRLGCGRLLLDHARDYVEQAGGKQISISLIHENTRLKNWYADYGFVETAIRRYDHLPFTVCFMALDL